MVDIIDKFCSSSEASCIFSCILKLCQHILRQPKPKGSAIWGFSPNLTAYGPAPKYWKLPLSIPLRTRKIPLVSQIPDHRLSMTKLQSTLDRHTHTHNHKMSRFQISGVFIFIKGGWTNITVWELYKGAQNDWLLLIHIAALGRPSPSILGHH